ncbi:nitrate ABC transporter ATP-binding protein [Methylobacterium variabile]|jgi:NitT/TauT family transport system ATP-binding protein|uniref:Nitrate ABC transporter ATP-binding protein n=1 Tax=Methylobacterium variabile TaxID=298794 RepID=A0A0J6SQU6_9HYPH|nr:ABC transporter ATP-binding protein [Methylobacterium variabile]KMO37610.1 nitrate ABC transporter ATP-binding protein [Methylobacterium variabile]
MPTDAFLALEGVRYRFPGDAAATVDGVDWAIPRGTIHCLLGRSGCGKTTLLKLAAGLLAPDAGTVRIDGAVVRGPSPRVGFVFQAPTLLEWLSALDNVLLPVSLKRRPRAADREAARDLLAAMGLGDLVERRPAALSGGQQSRVAMARALIAAPDLLLLDEPFAALDALTREELQDDLLRLCAARGTAALFVTHDIAEAVYLGDRIGVMAAGHLIHEGAVPLPRPRPAGIRYEAAFGAACRRLRAIMDGPSPSVGRAA